MERAYSGKEASRLQRGWWAAMPAVPPTASVPVVANSHGIPAAAVALYGGILGRGKSQVFALLFSNAFQ
jgi:hypothetical protein